MAKAPTIITTGDLEGMRTYAVGNEVSVLDRIKADIAAGRDPYGEDEDDDGSPDLTSPPPKPASAPEPANAPASAPTDAPAPAPIDTPAPAPAPVDTNAAATSVEAPAAATSAPVLADTAVPVDVSDLRGLTIPVVPQVDVRAYETARDGLRSQMDAIDAKWEAGEITPAERSAQLRPLSNQLDSLNSEHAANIGEQRATQRIAESTHQRVLSRIAEAGVRDGLNYSDVVHQQQFDMASQMIMADPKLAAKGWVEVARLADLQVRAINGINPGKTAPATPAAPAAAPTPAPTPAAAAPAAPAVDRTPPAVPPTLRSMPAAAGPGSVTDTVSSRLQSGDANQRNELWSKLSKAEQARLRGDDD